MNEEDVTHLDVTLFPLLSRNEVLIHRTSDLFPVGSMSLSEMAYDVYTFDEVMDRLRAGESVQVRILPLPK